MDDARDAVPASPARRVVTAATVLAALGAILLILPELWLAGGGLVWAVAGLAKLGTWATIALAVLVAIPLAHASGWIVRRSFEAETDPDNAST